MRDMYWKCKLIHADLSEYNILINTNDNNKIYIIDVSQSVENNHPNAYYFLVNDCKNTNDYFRKSLNINTLTNKEFFNFIINDIGIIIIN